ncbi:MAG: pyrroline-5-carboxylate reductase [Proteobacteria bacterium]|nr:pyrroline-5-carboxylate reductase [Pseudomonadota bacterium]
MSNNNLAFIGGGNMTRAIVGGLLESGFGASRVFVSEPVAEARDSLAKDLPGITSSGDNKAIAAAASAVMLSVKPQILPAVCRELRQTLQDTQPLIMSIAAGIRGADIDEWLGGGLSVVRIMPNQPALVRLGVSGLFANQQTSETEKARAAEIMGAVGSVVWVDSEADIDAVTAVSGSGPAYFFLLIDMLKKTAVQMGLKEDVARTLAIETASGAAALAAAETDDMEVLIERVRSPGGTTAAALDSLDNANIRDIFSTAITSARDRANVLADEAHNSED